MTPLKVKYETAWEQTHPFNRVVPEYAESTWAREMILDVTALVYKAMERDEMVDVLTNNRAYGNAPELNREVARRVLQEEERRQA